MKFKYDVAYENNSDKFNNGHCRIKVKVTGGLQKFPLFTAIQTVKSYTQLGYKLGSLY